MRGRVDVRGGRALTRGSVDALQRALRAELADLDARDLRRDLRAPRGVDFASNDYLGLASSTAFRDALRARLNAALDGERGTWAAPASRLLRGNTVAHRALEQRFAQLKNAEDALLFPSGYQANVGLLTALVRPHDRVLSDAQNHASLIDGLRLARCRNKVIVPHLDLDAWAEALARPHPEAAQDGRTFVLVESLYSMDGDRAPLAEIAALATRHDAHLLIDDAHATGLYGPRGAGLAAQPAIARSAAAVVSTCGKSLGLSGAFVTGSRTLVAYLVSRCRSFIFSTAPPPLHVAALTAALDVVARAADRRRAVLRGAARLRARLRAAGCDCLASTGPIVPVMIGDNRSALAVADALARRGWDVRAIRPPTVAPGTARLRISVHADHDDAQLDALADDVVRALRVHAATAAARAPGAAAMTEVPV